MADETEKKGKDVFTGGVKVEGKHTEAPTDFNFEEFKPIPKADFVSEEIFLDHQANICHAKAEIFMLKAEKCTKQAAKLREYGDPETRKKVMKLSKMREQLAALQKALEDDDVDLSLIDD